MTVKIACFIRPQKSMCVTRSISNANYHTCVLNPTVWVKKLRANRTDIIAQSMGRHCAKPARLNDLDIVVQKA